MRLTCCSRPWTFSTATWLITIEYGGKMLSLKKGTSLFAGFDVMLILLLPPPFFPVAFATTNGSTYFVLLSCPAWLRRCRCRIRGDAPKSVFSAGRMVLRGNSADVGSLFSRGWHPSRAPAINSRAKNIRSCQNISWQILPLLQSARLTKLKFKVDMFPLYFRTIYIDQMRTIRLLYFVECLQTWRVNFCCIGLKGENMGFVTSTHKKRFNCFERK